MEVSDARRLKALEEENAKLKKLSGEAMLDNARLREVAARTWGLQLLDERPSLTSAGSTR
jgi:putative transposase